MQANTDRYRSWVRLNFCLYRPCQWLIFFLNNQIFLSSFTWESKRQGVWALGEIFLAMLQLIVQCLHEPDLMPAYQSSNSFTSYLEGFHTKSDFQISFKCWPTDWGCNFWELKLKILHLSILLRINEILGFVLQNIFAWNCWFRIPTLFGTDWNTVTVDWTSETTNKQ